jgi:hypothetical protein
MGTTTRFIVPVMPPNASFKIIGLGGVGSIVARYGAVFLASANKPATMILLDGDSFEPKNAARMIFTEMGNKAETIRKDMVDKLGTCSLTIMAIPQFVEPKNIDTLIKDGDIVMMCVDNHATRKAISKHCEKLDNITLISGGNDGVDDGKRGTYGNCQIYVREKGKELCIPITKYHPEIENPKDKLPSEMSCMEQLESVPQILFANLAVASSMLNALLLCLSKRAYYCEACFDIAEGLSRPLDIPGPYPKEAL